MRRVQHYYFIVMPFMSDVNTDKTGQHAANVMPLAVCHTYSMVLGFGPPKQQRLQGTLHKCSQCLRVQTMQK